MLRYAFRRLLWLLPSVFGITVVAFYLLSLTPRGFGSDDDRASAVERQRHRYLDLPLFFNFEPRDLGARVRQSLDTIAAALPESEEAIAARRELVRLGGAAFPLLLPKLDTLAPVRRKRVAQALAPVARRMGLEGSIRYEDPEQAVLFWSRFWEIRSIEYRDANALSVVRRYAQYGTEARAQEIQELDAFSLPALLTSLQVPVDRASMERARRLVGAAAKVTGRSDRIGERATLGEAKSCVERWQRWWLVYRSDYLRLVGASRIAAFALETRYGKWVLEALSMRLGKDGQGRPVLSLLISRSRVTLSIIFLGLALAYLLAIPLGALSARRRGKWDGQLVGSVVLLPYALSSLGLVALVMAFGHSMSPSTALASVLLALVLLADPVRHQRSALLPVLASDYVRAAVARGAGPWRVIVVHGLRNAMVPVVTRATLDLPVALTACFVFEQAFGLDGLGRATVMAASHYDVSWLMAVTIVGAVWAVFALTMSDVAYVLLDRRMRTILVPHRGRRV